MNSQRGCHIKIGCALKSIYILVHLTSFTQIYVSFLLNKSLSNETSYSEKRKWTT